MLFNRHYSVKGEAPFNMVRAALICRSLTGLSFVYPIELRLAKIEQIDQLFVYLTPIDYRRVGSFHQEYCAEEQSCQTDEFGLRAVATLSSLL